MDKHRGFSTCYVLLAVACAFGIAAGLDNGLGLTPQMGWNSWNHFQCNVDEEIIRNMAMVMHNAGLQELGYTYVNIDDCWAEMQRSSSGKLVPRSDTFPSGMKYLSDYVHSLGLKLGIYSDAGTTTCGGQPGSLGYEDVDAQSFADWGIDYLKYDNCNNNDISPKIRYPPMRDALNKTGRPIFFSMCEWGEEDPALWASEVGNSWRTTGDIDDSWTSMTSIADLNDKWADYAKPGGWNDPDMLEVGNEKMTHEEYRAHFSIWALAKAPLILGNDLSAITSDTLDIISNLEIIAVNQDSLGVQGKKVNTAGTVEVWTGPLSGGRTVVVLWNRGPDTTTITANWKDLSISTEKNMKARDLWLQQDLQGRYNNSITTSVQSHDVAMFILSPVE